MTLPDGMYLYEVVLLMCGALLFLVLLIAFLRLVFTNRPYLKLLPFFLLPVAMMGFPSISSIKVNDGVVEIEKKVHQLQERPDDKELRASLQADVSNVSARPFKNPKTLTTIAQAQFALGQDKTAEATLDQALKVAPTLAPATDLKTKMQLTKNLTALTTAAESQPENTQVREELQQTYSKLSQQPVANPNALSTLSKAKTILATGPAATNPRTGVMREVPRRYASPGTVQPNH